MRFSLVEKLKVETDVISEAVGKLGHANHSLFLFVWAPRTDLGRQEASLLLTSTVVPFRLSTKTPCRIPNLSNCPIRLEHTRWGVLVCLRGAMPTRFYCRWGIECTEGFSRHSDLASHVVSEHVRKSGSIRRGDLQAIERAEEGIGESISVPGLTNLSESQLKDGEPHIAPKEVMSNCLYWLCY